MPKYKIIAKDLIPAMTYIKEKKFPGFFHPNLPGGTLLFELEMEPEDLLMLRLSVVILHAKEIDGTPI